MQNDAKQTEKRIIVVRAIIKGFSCKLAELTHLPAFHFESMLGATATDLFDFIAQYEQQLDKETDPGKK